jgi:hypothetical protein
MKLGVIIPSEEQKAQAGVRIRYERIRPAWQTLGHELELIPIQHLATLSKPTYDIYLISKCYDARAIMAAEHLSSQGALVGVDLFDDYFSQWADSRFVRQRYWLRTLLPHCSFILCSTPGMRDLANMYSSNLPMHVMNDPPEPFDTEVLAATLASKLAIAREQRRVEVAWFGMGDNPNFSVGLADLAAFGSEVDRLRGHGYAIRLSILTNPRAMTADNLAPLAKLATPHTIEEWTTEREAALLGRSLVSFLPVNAQGFSRVKSLNRAITALTAGAQVFSAGYPLYKPLDLFIYRNGWQLLHDLDGGELALRTATMPQFLERIRQLADVDTEARALAEFLISLKSRAQSVALGKPALAVIHGKETLGDTHKFAQKKNILSVGSPLCKLELNFDVRIRCDQQGKIEVLVSKKRRDLLAPELERLSQQIIELLQTEYLVFDKDRYFPDLATRGHSLIEMNTPAADAAAYPPVMGWVTDVMHRLFPGINCILSEQSKHLPWVVARPTSHEVRQ